MRRRVEEHVLRLPVSRFDSTQTGILIARIMSDAEGIRNLVGTGLVQLLGGFVTATIALGVLFWLNWKLTAGTLVFLVSSKGRDVREFLSEARFELRKVVWPTRQETTRMAWVVIIVVVIVSLLLAGFDFFVQKGIQWFLGR